MAGGNETVRPSMWSRCRYSVEYLNSVMPFSWSLVALTTA